MSERDGESREPATSNLAAVEPGEQVLVSLPGQRFEYGRLPASALENLLVLSVGRNPTQIQRTLESLDADPRTVGVVPVSGSGIDYDGPMWTGERVSPMDFTGISIQFTRGFGHVKPDEGWVLVDSVSILLMYADLDRVYRLLDSMVQACRAKDVRGIYVVDSNAVTEETMRRLRSLFDRVEEW